jgi:dTDP-4-dehydrorhamnose reductase
MWLLLGAAGQLGHCLASELTKRRVQFVGLERGQCDITSISSVQEALSAMSPQVVINCAAWTAVDQAEDNETAARVINRDGVQNVASICNEVGAILVQVSTDYVFKGTGTSPLDEYSATEPVTAYGRTKLEGESVALAANPERTYIVRTAWLYSQYGHNFAKTMVRKAIEKSAVTVVNDQTGQPTNAYDLAAHIIDIVESGVPTGVYHGTNAGQGTWHDFAVEIYSLLGRDSRLVTPVDSSRYPTRAVRPAYSVLSHGRTTSNGLIEMRDWREALASCIGDIKQAVEAEIQ